MPYYCRSNLWLPVSSLTFLLINLCHKTIMRCCSTSIHIYQDQFENFIIKCHCAMLHYPISMAPKVLISYFVCVKNPTPETKFPVTLQLANRHSWCLIGTGRCKYWCYNTLLLSYGINLSAELSDCSLVARDWIGYSRAFKLL